jgi:hypothetical protein
LIGDSSVRGLYKDLACILSGHDRLLNLNELKFNRHQEKKKEIFGEQIYEFYVNRTNSIYNLERRTLYCGQLNSNLTYVFSSRIWNETIEKTMSIMKNYDTLLISSQIWDLTRFGDNSRELYLKNIDVCFSQLKLFNKNVIWLLTPPVDNDKHRGLSELLLATNPCIISKTIEYGFMVVDFSEHLKSHLNLRALDGIHWTPQGHRLMTQYLNKYISQLPKQNLINVIHPLVSTDVMNDNENISARKFIF